MNLRLLHPMSPEGRFGFKVFTHLRNKAQRLTKHGLETCSRHALMVREPFQLPHYLSPRLDIHFATIVTSETRIGTTIPVCTDSARQN